MRAFIWAILLLAAAAGCGGKDGDAKGGKEGKAAARPALTVTTTTPQQASLQVTLAANGNLTAWQEASVGAEVAGLRIAEVRVNVGDRVKLIVE